MIDLCTLGTGGALPLPDRALSSLYVRVNGRALLIDCGEGTQVGIRRLGWGFRCLDGLLITHFHGDHCGGLPGLLLSLDKAGRTEPFHLYGPAGLRRVVEGLRVIAPVVSYPVALHEIAPGDAFSLIGLTIDAFALRHGIPCLGYRLRLLRQPAFDPVKARALNIPLPLWKRLQAGETVQTDGRSIVPADVQGAPRPGLSLLYATDTRPVESIVRLGEGADLMMLEGMYGDEAKRPQALKNHHMLFAEAAALAREARAKSLLLTHFSNCVDDPEDYLPQARVIFPETRCAHDGLTLTLHYPERAAAI